MKVTKKTAGETARERVIVAVCDVFDIRKTMVYYAQRGYEATGEWKYANREKTIVRITFAMPMRLEFDLHDLLDDLIDLFIRGRYSRREAITVLDALQAQEGGAR